MTPEENTQEIKRRVVARMRADFPHIFKSREQLADELDAKLRFAAAVETATLLLRCGRLP